MSEVKSVLPSTQRGTRKERVKHKIAFLVTVLFNVFMRQTLIDDIWGLHKNMNCTFPSKQI